METLEGLVQAEGKGGRVRLFTPPISCFFFSPRLLLSGLCPSYPMAAPYPFIPSIPILWAHILGVKGIVASTAELVTALGAVKVHTASSGQCIRELALGAVCKGQQVRARAATVP